MNPLWPTLDQSLVDAVKRGDFERVRDLWPQRGTLYEPEDLGQLVTPLVQSPQMQTAKQWLHEVKPYLFSQNNDITNNFWRSLRQAAASQGRVDWLEWMQQSVAPVRDDLTTLEKALIARQQSAWQWCVIHITKGRGLHRLVDKLIDHATPSDMQPYWEALINSLDARAVRKLRTRLTLNAQGPAGEDLLDRILVFTWTREQQQVHAILQRCKAMSLPMSHSRLVHDRLDHTFDQAMSTKVRQSRL